ncbi:hypothetical protein [Algoriphagus marinus]|uniref:hypothetical protein n=1 Tax=Algoriphagus marinus TaxID=1925762 RepID=UPI00094BA11A|nr:hypothetical protein [Algoriphagus marinus]
MLTLNEFHQILKSCSFKSEVAEKTDSYIFNFTEIYIFRDGKPLCIYELIQDKTTFKFIFGNLFQNISTSEFKNVTIMIQDDDRFPIVVNSYYLSSQSGQGLDITLIAQ